MIKTYEEALEKVFKKEIVEDYSIEKAKKALDYLGNPLKNIKVIHIAGTNGKGSVSKMIYSVLKKAGKKVGVYTSPHLVDIRDRFLSYDSKICEEEFVYFVNQILDLPFSLSYFEKTTLIAFLFFQKRKLDYAIVEVGFGGLLDTTNIVSPFITAITSIGHDHMHILGNTLEEISYQKAGIIKEGIPIVYNHKNKVIEDTAKQKNAPIIFTDKKVKTNLKGDFQEKNAAITYEVCKYLGIEDESIISGLQEVNHPGRLDSLKPNLLIDGAHNREGLIELKKYLDTIKNDFQGVKYAFSLKYGKDVSLITDIFGMDKNYILVNLENNMLEKNHILMDMMDKVGLDYKNMIVKDIIKQAEEQPNTLFVVFGSLYVIGEFFKV